MFKKALRILKFLKEDEDDDYDRVMFLLERFLEENYEIGLALSRMKIIKQKGELKNYKIACYDILQPKLEKLGSFIRSMVWEMNSGFGYDDLLWQGKWENICKKASMLEFLYEMGDETFLGDFMEIYREEELKQELIRFGTLIMEDLGTIVIPNDIPEHHWWWKIPELPPENDDYFDYLNEYVLFIQFKKVQE